NGVDAGIFFAITGQINILIPNNVLEGLAVVAITDATGATRSGTVSISRTAPAIFTANNSGTGTAAALTTTDGRNFQSVLNPDGSERPVDPGTAANPNFLVLFGTGIRNAPSADPNNKAAAVTATIQGVPATVAFAGGLATPGLDQLNIIIPPSLAGFGQV